MTKEEKELLLKDLYLRVPHGVIVETYWEFENKNKKTFPKKILTYKMLEYYIGEDKWKYNIHFLPYLRPMSSMTREEHAYYFYYQSRLRDGILGTIGEYLDWLNENMFDYRGLIPKGLALEAKEGMYKI